MNKRLLVCNLAWLLITSAIVLHSCNSASAPAASPCSASQTCKEDYVDFMPPQFLLDAIARYKKYQWEGSKKEFAEKEKIQDFNDARSCWYSLDRLKNMICLTEKNACDSGWTDGMGIRFYYATYPDSAQQSYNNVVFDSTLKHFVNLTNHVPVGLHHTLFMVPTHYNSESHLDEDVYLIRKTNVPEKGAIPHILESRGGFVVNPNWGTLLDPKLSSSTVIFALGGGPTQTFDPSAKNQGLLCPPTCSNGATTVLNSADILGHP